MTEIQDKIKAIGALDLTAGEKLIAITMALCKTSDTATLCVLTGENRRAVQRARTAYLDLCDKSDRRDTCVASENDRRDNRDMGVATDATDATPVSPLAPTHARNEPPTGVVISKPVDSSSSSSPRTCASDEDDVAAAMVRSVCVWARMPEVNARIWLANTISVFGQEATARGYHILKTKVASGEIVSKPLMFWTTASRNEKDQAAKRREPPAKTKPTIREVLAARAAEAIQ